MKRLVGFELRKIWKNPLSIAAVASVFMLSLLLSFSTFRGMYASDGRSREGAGAAAVAVEKELASRYQGILTDEKVQQMLAEFKPDRDLMGLNVKYLYMNSLQSAVFYRFSDNEGNWNGLSTADVFGDEEIKVGYVNGWLSTSQNLAKVLVFLSLAVILMTAPVFAGEYSGADNFILTSRYGKTKCAGAKVAAGLLSAVVITAFVLAVHLIPAFVFYGREGLDCSVLFAPMEFSQSYIPFNITCGTVLKYQIMLAFMSAVSVTGITLMVSAVCKKQMSSFAISAAVYAVPILLPVSETSGLYRILVLMPLYYSQYISIMSVEQTENGLLYAVWAMPAAMLIMIAGAIISQRRFRRHQVYN